MPIHKPLTKALALDEFFKSPDARLPEDFVVVDRTRHYTDEDAFSVRDGRVVIYQKKPSHNLVTRVLPEKIEVAYIPIDTWRTYFPESIVVINREHLETITRVVRDYENHFGVTITILS